MRSTDASSSSSSPHHHMQFATAIIYRCLAPCKECTGNYISEILQKRFLCRCRCHKLAEDDDISSATTSYLREDGI